MLGRISIFNLWFLCVEGDDDDDDDDEEEDEEDPEDPADALRESCTKSATCRPLLKSFDTCEERVSSKSKTEETCLEEYISFIKCRDKCVSISLILCILKSQHTGMAIYYS